MNALLVHHPGQLTLPQRRALLIAIKEENRVGVYRPRGKECASAAKLAAYGLLTAENSSSWLYHVTDAGFAMGARIRSEP